MSLCVLFWANIIVIVYIYSIITWCIISVSLTRDNICICYTPSQIVHFMSTGTRDIALHCIKRTVRGQPCCKILNNKKSVHTRTLCKIHFIRFTPRYYILTWTCVYHNWPSWSVGWHRAIKPSFDSLYSWELLEMSEIVPFVQSRWQTGCKFLSELILVQVYFGAL